jgi:hypothetical protein
MALVRAASERQRHPAVAIYEAENAWEREERRQLVRWLAQHVHVLIGPQS